MCKDTENPYPSVPEERIYENRIFDSVSTEDTEDADAGDGITVYGYGHRKCLARRTIIRNCVFDFRNIPAELQDEAIAGVYGANVIVENTIIIGAKKAMLCGNGDHPEQDKLFGKWHLKNVAFIGCGRRCPEAQDGVHVLMQDCLIENWGESFDVRAFGTWAHHGAVIEAQNCFYIQNRFWTGLIHFLVDIGNHIGQAFNDRALNPLTYIIPGVFRGAESAVGGRVHLTDCYMNSPFVHLENSTVKSCFTEIALAFDYMRRDLRKSELLRSYVDTLTGSTLYRDML